MLDTGPVERRDFTYCSAYYGGLGVHDYLVMTPSRPAARERARAYAVARWGEPRKIDLYPRRYVREARALYAAGKHDGQS